MTFDEKLPILPKIIQLILEERPILDAKYDFALKT